MIAFSLQSGSNGNSIYVEAGDVRLLIDAGISGKQAEGRMRLRQRDIREVDGLLISHDHTDHVRGAGVFQRKFGIPIYMTPATHARAKSHLGPVRDVRHFAAGQTLEFDGVRVHTVPTPHDAVDGVAFVIEHDGQRLGVMTDLGHPFARLTTVLADLHAVFLESNYDPHMLATGPYPADLQARIRGQHGHLSNDESAELIRAATRTLKWAALAHLSEHNNHPDVALDTFQRCVGKDFPVTIASRYEVGPLLEL